MPLCANCGEENPERAKFCLNCGSSLLPRCPSCGEENPERAKFCLNCGSPLAEAGPPLAPPRAPDEERKLDTLVFVDLVGSTALAEQLDPEDVLALLELYYTRLRAELERHGGTVEKYIGDAIVTHFGVPVAHEDDPERAVRAALDILDTVVALNAEDPIREIQVRIGVATGEVIVRHDQRAEEGKGIAWGDVLNTAARIESAAPVNGILVGEETYRATAHTIEYLDREPIEAKGKGEPVPVWQAVGVKETPVRGRVRAAPLVGRAAELAQLTELWSRVTGEGRPALATIVGDPGIGKSRLLTELAHRISEDGDVLWGRCLSYGEGITYWPVEEMLEGAAGILKSDDPETVSTKLAVLLDRFGAEDPDRFRTIAATLANLVGVGDSEHPVAAEMSQAELHWGIRRVLELMAADRPLMLVFEDIHWAEPTLFDLIEFLGEATAPILVVGSARRELRELRPDFCTDGEHRTTMSLSALGEDESEALLAELLGDRALPPGGKAEMLLRNAAGNPLFLEETVRMLDDAGVLDGADIDELAIPTSLQAMIGSRLDGLPAQDKSVAHHASVVGMTFWSGAVAELHGTEAVDPSLEALEQRDFVRGADGSSVADEREWSFKHALIRDVAYARVPKGRRAHLHVRFADWMQGIPGASEELVEILAYHLEQACRHAGVGRSDAPPPIERAVEALMSAAEKAERREGIREADRFYGRALEVIGDSESELALEALLGRAGTLNTLGQLETADELFERVAEAAPTFVRDDLRARALLGRSVVAVKQGRGPAARALVLEAEAIADRVGERRVRTRAMYWASNISAWFFEGAGEDVAANLNRALAIADELGDPALQLEGHMWMQVLLYNLGDLHGAEAELMRCESLLPAVGSLREEARVTYQLGIVKYHQGHLAEAEELGLRALDWLDRTGDSFYQLQNLRALALCAVARGDLTVAEARLRQALDIAPQSGGTLVVELYRCLVNVLVRQNRHEEARALGEIAERSAPDEDAYARAACLLIDAAVATSDEQQVRNSYAEALRLLEEQRLPLDLGEARLAYGRALRRLGDDTEATAELHRAKECVEGTGALGLLGEIDRELTELREGAGRPGPLARS
jgi:class 3 adenylate cyclase/tetratricopeptide (TPR) repeat protein